MLDKGRATNGRNCSQLLDPSVEATPALRPNPSPPLIGTFPALRPLMRWKTRASAGRRAPRAPARRRLNSSSARQVSRTASAARSAPSARSRVASSAAARAGRRGRPPLGADGDDDEVAVPGGELLERREQLLALGAALRPLAPLLGLARRQLEASSSASASSFAARRAPRRLEQRAPRRPARTRLAVDGARRREQLLAPRPPPGRAAARRGRAARRDARERRPLGLVEPRRARGEHSRTDRSDRRRNGTSWQRERIVSRQRAELVGDEHDHGVRGGSSRSFSSASAASSFSRCAPKIR